MSTSNSIIIFGPTGNVASNAAVTASKLGAKVYLAMRDDSKKIPDIPEQDEKSGDYVRVKADLTDPESVKNAVKESGAKKAFFYLMHAAKDGMKETIQALKDGGVEFVVFLSSFTVREPLEDIPPADIIPYGHAQVEIRLLEIFGKESFVALRPGGFATNILMWHGDEIKAKKVRLQAPEAPFDGITPEDMGEVAGNILAKENKEKHAVYLFGPKYLSRLEQVKVAERALGETFEIEEIGEEEAVQQYVSKGIPESFARYLAGTMANMSKKGGGASGGAGKFQSAYEEGVKNVEDYTGHPAMGFEEWVQKNLHRFR